MRIAQAVVLLHMRDDDDAAASRRAMHHGLVSTRQKEYEQTTALLTGHTHKR